MPLNLDVRTLSGPVLALDGGMDSVALVLALPATPAESWPRRVSPASSDDEVVAAARAFLQDNGVERPALSLVCSMGRHGSAESSAEGRAARIARWREELRQSGGRPEFFLHERMNGWEAGPLLEAVKEAFGPAHGADSGTASVLAALSLEAVCERSWSEGVSLLFADGVHVQAFMIFQEKVLGLYENHAQLDRDSLLADLRELRLNWLPDEQVRAAGGHGCICGDFPAEAEGFRPTWLLGTHREVFKGAGRLSSPCGDARFERCFGLLCGLERLKEAQA